MVGFYVSPKLSSGAGIKLSAGRVQSPAVKIIVLRERSIKSFKSQKHFSLKIKVGEGIEASLNLSKLLPNDEKYLFDKFLLEPF